MSKLGSDHGDGDEMAATHFEFDVDRENPEVNVAAVTAELEGRDVDDLPPLYEAVDHLIEQLYATPPSAAAQVRMEFTYEGYRIVLNQDGFATFMKIDGTG